MATLEELDEDALVQILTEPKNALSKQYGKMIEMEGCEIEFGMMPYGRLQARPWTVKPVLVGYVPFWRRCLLDTMYELPSLEERIKSGH